MDVIDTWTGRRAHALQQAMRLTNEAFAAKLGISVRTVAHWHAHPDATPGPEIQQILDTTHERASDAVHRRFALLSRTPAGSGQAQALRVGVAVVVNGDEVLLVQRRGDASLTWQFPAGVVKPGAAPEATAVHETLAETGVHCAVRTHLGARLHPVTGVLCDYYLCDYLAGDAANADVVENTAVQWVALRMLARFIPADRIYPPILDALKEIA